MHASLSHKEIEAEEIREWYKNDQGRCLQIWEKGTNSIEEFDLPSSKQLKELLPKDLK